MAIDDATKGLPGHKVHDLREQGFACVHGHLQVIEPLEHAWCGKSNSNRGHP
jgi:hypothetical protein